MKEIRKMGVLLFVICAVAAALLAMTNAVTAPKIAENAEKRGGGKTDGFACRERISGDG